MSVVGAVCQLLIEVSCVQQDVLHEEDSDQGSHYKHQQKGEDHSADFFLGVPVDFDKTKSRHSRMEYQPFVGQNLKVFKENGGIELNLIRSFSTCQKNST